MRFNRISQRGREREQVVILFNAQQHSSSLFLLLFFFLSLDCDTLNRSLICWKLLSSTQIRIFFCSTTTIRKLIKLLSKWSGSRWTGNINPKILSKKKNLNRFKKSETCLSREEKKNHGTNVDLHVYANKRNHWRIHYRHISIELMTHSPSFHWFGQLNYISKQPIIFIENCLAISRYFRLI